MRSLGKTAKAIINELLSAISILDSFDKIYFCLGEKKRLHQLFDTTIDKHYPSISVISNVNQVQNSQNTCIIDLLQAEHTYSYAVSKEIFLVKLFDPSMFFYDINSIIIEEFYSAIRWTRKNLILKGSNIFLFDPRKYNRFGIDYIGSKNFECDLCVDTIHKYKLMNLPGGEFFACGPTLYGKVSVDNGKDKVDLILKGRKAFLNDGKYYHVVEIGSGLNPIFNGNSILGRFSEKNIDGMHIGLGSNYSFANHKDYNLIEKK